MWTTLTPTVTRIDVFGALGYPEIDDAPAMRFCIPQLSAKLSGLEVSLGQIFQSIFDTAVLALILYKTRRRGGSGIITLIVKQGLVYYMLNMALYLTWTFMLVFAPPEDASKQVIGGPALGLVCVSVNRLTLHLRSFDSDLDSRRTMAPRSERRQRRNSWLGASTLDVREVFSGDELSTLEMHDFDRDGLGDGGSGRKLHNSDHTNSSFYT